MLELNQCSLTMPIVQCMIRSWMLSWGRYERYNSQSCYAGGNERFDVLESRKEYIKQK